MQYIQRKSKSKGTYRLFENNETLCRQSSTGGLDIANYNIIESVEGLKCCVMCESVANRKSRPTEKPIEYCEWSPDQDDSSWYESECGMSFVFETDGPIQNEFKYCPKCGKLLKDTRFRI